MDTRSETQTLFEFFKESRFMIPEIQRNYTWTAKEQVGKLVTDLCKFFSADHSIVPQYFLGTAILYDGAEYDGAKDIMDGQQRVTSIIVMYSAIKAILEKGKQSESISQSRKDQIEDVIEEISERIIFHDEGFDKCRLEPKDKLDRKIIDVITKLDGKELSDVFQRDQHKREIAQPLSQAFVYFYDKLSDFAVKTDPENPVDVLIKFANVIGERVLLTKTITKTLPMAFQMFVSVNGRKAIDFIRCLRGIVIAKVHSLGLQRVNTMLRSLNREVEVPRDTQSDEKKQIQKSLPV